MESSNLDKVERLKELLASGTITKKEFEEQKAQILSGRSKAPKQVAHADHHRGVSKTALAGIAVVIIIVVVAVVLLYHPSATGTQGAGSITQRGTGAPVLMIPKSSLTYDTSESILANVSSANNNWMVELYVNGTAVAGPATSVTYLLRGVAVGNLNVTAKNIETGAFSTMLVQVTPANPVLTIGSYAINYGTNETISAVGSPSTEEVEILVNGKGVTNAQRGVVDYTFNQNYSMSPGNYSISAVDVNANLYSNQTLTIKELPSYTYTKSTDLNNNVSASNVYIAPGAVVNTNGYNFYVTNNFTDKGTIVTGYNNGDSYPLSYGGSVGADTGGANGENTTANGGVWGGHGNPDGSMGSTLPTQQLSNFIATWNSQGIQNYLEGGGGGRTCCSGNGGYGLYVQAQNITISGLVYANGQSGNVGSCGGGGGGGVILLAYSDNIETSGAIMNVSGGNAGTGVAQNKNCHNQYGNGGSGQIVTYKYTYPPVIP